MNFKINYKKKLIKVLIYSLLEVASILTAIIIHYYLSSQLRILLCVFMLFISVICLIASSFILGFKTLNYYQQDKILEFNYYESDEIRNDTFKYTYKIQKLNNFKKHCGFIILTGEFIMNREIVQGTYSLYNITSKPRFHKRIIIPRVLLDETTFLKLINS